MSMDTIADVLWENFQCVRFIVPAVPVAQPRQRFRVLKIGNRVIPQNYTPTKSPVNEFKAVVKMAFRQAYSGPPIDGALRVDWLAVFPRPKSATRKRGPNPRFPHIKKPDRDNLDKAILDALKGLAFADDCQVCGGAMAKWVADGDEQPFVEITISRVTGNEKALG